MNRDTGESPGENRGPLLLYFLCLHPPDRPASPTARFIFSRQGEFRAQGRGSLLAAAARCTDSLCASGGPISFSSERNGGKNAAKNQWFLEFLSSDHSYAAKRPTPNRSCPYPRCRFHMPRGNAVSYRRGTVYLRVVRRSGSDKRTARDSLYDDVRQFKSRVVRGGGFQRTPAAQEVLKPAVSSSVLVTFGAAAKSDPRSEVRCPPFEKKNERAVEDDADPCKKHIALQKKGSRALGRGIPVTINRCPA